MHETDFGFALKALKARKRVCRKGWNGKGMFLEYVPAQEWESEVCIDAERLPFIAMFTAQSQWVPWLASQTDLLSDDWELFRAAL